MRLCGRAPGMLAEALRAGVDAYIAAFAAERGRRLVVRNGYHQPREVLTAAACAPVLAVRDGALGFWRALREVLPKTREGRCWFHKSANVLAALPKSAHPGRRRPWRRSGTPRAAIHLRRGEGVCGRLQGQVPQKTC